MPLYAPPLFPDGTSAAPGIAFAANPAAGFFRPSSTNIRTGILLFSASTGEYGIGGAGRIAWYTGSGFAAVNIALIPAGASTTRLEVGTGIAGNYLDLIARQLFAGGDSTAGIASSTSFTNATNGTVTNAYTVNGGQAATTSNTGWIKIYVGTAVAWLPYWQNATP